MQTVPPTRPLLRRGRRVVLVLGAYLLAPLLNAVSPLLALPAITGTHGVGAWAAVALGQSLGATAGVVIELGWGMAGTQRVARQSRRSRARSFALSVTTKGIVAVPGIAAAAILAAALAPSFTADAAVVAAAAALSMFAAGWIFIGTMQPRHYLSTEVVPRALLIAGAAAAIQFGAPLSVYSGALLAAAVFAPIAAAVVLRVRPSDFTAFGFRRCLLVIRCQAAALTSNLFSSLYISLGVTVATLGSPHATALYAAVDRLQRMVQQVAIAQQSLLKGWVGRCVDPVGRVARARRAVLIALVAGSVLGTAFALWSPLAARVVFSGTVAIPTAAAVVGGLSVLVVCVSMATGFILLVALGRVDAVARSAVAGALVGTPLIYLGSTHAGATGALSGQLAAELVVLAVQVAVVLRELRRRSVPRPALRGAAGIALTHVRRTPDAAGRR